VDGRLGLAEVIESLRAELDEAATKGAGKRIQFNVGAVDLEFQVEVSREGGASAKVRFWVVEAGVDGSVSSASTQTVKIHLEPVDSVTKTQVAVADMGGPAPARPTAAAG